jgi:hypothetical protein
MDTTTGIQVGLQIIGAATVLLNIIAPLTKNTIDNKIVAWMKLILSRVSLNVDSLGNQKVVIDIKNNTPGTGK